MKSFRDMMSETSQPLPGQRTHIINKDIRHPEHGIITTGTVVRHTGGNQYEIRAGRARGKIIGIDKEHVDKMSMEEVDLDEALTKLEPGRYGGMDVVHKATGKRIGGVAGPKGPNDIYVGIHGSGQSPDQQKEFKSQSAAHEWVRDRQAKQIKGTRQLVKAARTNEEVDLDEGFKKGDFVKDSTGQIHRVRDMQGNTLHTSPYRGKDGYGGNTTIHVTKATKVAKPADVTEGFAEEREGVAEGSLNEVTQGVEHSEWADNVRDAHPGTKIIKKRTEDGRHIKSQAMLNGQLVGQYNMNTGVGTFKAPKQQGVAEGFADDFLAMAKEKNPSARIVTADQKKKETEELMKKRAAAQAGKPRQPEYVPPDKYPLGGRDPQSGRSYSEEVESIDELRNTTQDQLGGRMGSSGPGSNKTPAGKAREVQRKQDHLKGQMKFTKSQGGIAGPKGKLPEETDLDEAKSTASKPYYRIISTVSPELRKQLAAADELSLIHI